MATGLPAWLVVALVRQRGGTVERVLSSLPHPLQWAQGCAVHWPGYLAWLGTGHHLGGLRSTVLRMERAGASVRSRWERVLVWEGVGPSGEDGVWEPGLLPPAARL